MIHNKLLSGAEALAIVLKKEKVKYVFAYPGTSELAMCNAILKIPEVTLINGRGDKETAFMAAGGSLLHSSNAVAILHGARGLTNATGAIADVNRNEIGTVFFVGLPSTSSARYLPPHGEQDLIHAIGNFTKNSDEITEVGCKDDSEEELERKAIIFISKIKDAIYQSRSLPNGPTMLGIPQDVSENKWISPILLKKYKPSSQKLIELNLLKLQKAITIIKEKSNPVILVDDFLYKNSKAKRQLLKFAESINALIFQIFYSRGPMFFETSLKKQNPYFIGYYKPQNPIHKKIVERANLLITLEDRNMYARIVGHLPNCQKIAITSNPKMTQKNDYLQPNDILLSGDVLVYMEKISNSVHKKTENLALKKFIKKIQEESLETIENNHKYDFMRKDIASELAHILSKIKQPIIVDDSQMFGGILAEGYEGFPQNLRVFGDHGGFIGGGLIYANGLARCEKSVKVFSTLGDQSFTNAIQGLISAVQEQIKIVYIVCNNEKSVSLFKQILSQDRTAFDHGKNKFLFNAPFDYSKIAKSLGIATFTIIFNNSTSKKNSTKAKLFRQVLKKALDIEGPVLVELKLPSSPEAWSGIWAIKGNE